MQWERTANRWPSLSDSSRAEGSCVQISSLLKLCQVLMGHARLLLMQQLFGIGIVGAELC